MKRTLVTGIVAGFLMVGGMVGSAQAALVSLIEQESFWQYTTLEGDLATNWYSDGIYNAVDWNDTSTWSTARAGFGNVDFLGTFAMHTFWQSGIDLALQKTFSVDGTINGDLTFNVASDNGFMMFLNGQRIARELAEGYYTLREYTFSRPSSYFLPGNNLLQIFAEDHGDTTFFDMRLTGDINPAAPVVDAVPEPATLLLLGTGLIGMIGLGRKTSLR